MENKNKTLGTIAFPSYQVNHHWHLAVLTDFNKANKTKIHFTLLKTTKVYSKVSGPSVRV